jgi:REP element-mobilizing transposase RayT
MDPKRAEKTENPKSANQEIGGPGVWHSRGYLPHFESSEVTQHVTFHLADSLPRTALQQMELELINLPEEKQDAERRKRVEAWVDAGHGGCELREPRAAEMVQGALLVFDGQRYRILAWVVMPNHVHALFQPMNGWTVAKIVASWKKFTARQICDWRRESGEDVEGAVWHREYWDRYIRDARHFAQTVEYIHRNPVKAGLVERPEEWRWSSAFAGNAGTANLPIGLLGFS